MKSKFLKNIIFVLSAFSLFVSSSPIHSVKASSAYVLGSPLSVDGRTNSTDYNCANYKELVLRSFWEGLSSLGLSSVPTVAQIESYLDPIFGNYFDNWESEGFDPSILCNIFYSNFYTSSNQSYFTLFLDFVPKDSLNASPSAYYYDSNGFKLTTNNYTTFYPIGYSGSPESVYFVPVAYSVTQGNFELIADYSDTRTLLPYSNYHKFVIVEGVPLSFEGSITSSSAYFNYWSTSYFPSSNNLGTSAYSARWNCIVSSFPFYNAPYYLKSTSNWGPRFAITTDFQRGYIRNGGLSDYGVYPFTISNYIVYSEFQFNLYDTPTPIPTIVPTLSPTPLPLAYDSNIDSFGSGETLGFLDYLSEKLGELSSHFVALSFISTTIGYIFHYAPWASIFLFIPLIAFLSFLIGRNKS